MLLASAVTPCGSISRAERPPADEIQAVADRVLAATVSIACSGEGGSFSGSGVVVTAEGHVLTAASVVPKGAAEVTVLLPGYRRRPAAIAVLDESLGITLLKVPTEEPLDFLPLARDPPAVGDTVFTAADIDDVMLANGRASLSRGVVSGIYGIERQAAAVATGHVIETSAAVNRGSNGGPLVDADGRVVGVISLAVSPRRWQGVAVPATAILDSLFPASRGVFPVRIDDATAPAAAPPLDGLRRSAAEIARFLVGIEVERTWPPEKLPRVSWSDYRTSVADWEKLTDDERRRHFAAYGVRSAMLDVNQLLRRPPGAVTGLVVSGDGFVLTSSFNIGDDTVFVGQASGRPRTFGGDESLEAMLAEPEGGVAPRPNAIRRVTVVCADGSRR